MFNEFPYANFHELNLDWIIQKVKEAYSPDNPPEGIVLSVNGEDGNVILYQDAIVRFPDVQDSTWNVHRTANGVSSGIQFTPTKAQRIAGTNRYDMYDSNNPPPYPVTSVNGQTGNVSIQIPVQSVNGQTGVVVIPPDFTSGDEIMEFTQESEGNYWGLSRTVSTGNASIYLDTSNNTVKAYISFNSTDGQTNVTYPLLTSADIPSSSGVISINSKTGAVTLYGSDIYTSENSQTTVSQDLASHGVAIGNLQQTQTEDHTSLIQTRTQVTTLNGQVNTLSNTVSQHSTAISTNSQRITTETNRAVNAEQNIMESVAILVTGNSSATGASVGQYVYVKGSTITGITDGLYIANQAIPANTSIDSSYLTAVSEGGLNSLQYSIAWKHHNKIQGTTINIPSTAKEYKVIASYGTSAGEQALCYVFDFLNSNSFHAKTITQGYALPTGNGFCQIQPYLGNYQVALIGFYINGTDYKDTCYLDVFYR